MRLWVYVATSAVLYIFLMLDALVMYPNYYSAMVGMSDTSFKLLALVNFSGSMTILCTKLAAWLLFDGLNMADQQSISSRALLVSTLVIQFWTPLHRQLALNSQAFLVGFLFLLSLTALHWICFNRVKSLQTLDPLAVDRRKIYKLVKLGVICSLFFTLDMVLCACTLRYFHSHELTGSFLSCVLVELVTKSVMFLGMYAVNIASMIYLYKNPEEDEWDRAQLLISLTKLASSSLSVGAYLFLIYTYGLSTMRVSLLLPYSIFAYNDAMAAYKAYTANSEMNQFTSDATDADLQRDNTCVICREEMSRSRNNSARKSPKKLNCGHVMHMGCLHSWLARSGSCPTCRQSVYYAYSSFRENDVGTEENTGTFENNTNIEEANTDINTAEAHHLTGHASGVALAAQVAASVHTNIQENASIQNDSVLSQPQTVPSDTNQNLVVYGTDTNVVEYNKRVISLLPPLKRALTQGNDAARRREAVRAIVQERMVGANGRRNNDGDRVHFTFEEVRIALGEPISTEEIISIFSEVISDVNSSLDPPLWYNDERIFKQFAVNSSQVRTPQQQDSLMKIIECLGPVMRGRENIFTKIQTILSEFVSIHQASSEASPFRLDFFGRLRLIVENSTTITEKMIDLAQINALNLMAKMMSPTTPVTELTFIMQDLFLNELTRLRDQEVQVDQVQKSVKAPATSRVGTLFFPEVGGEDMTDDVDTDQLDSLAC